MITLELIYNARRMNLLRDAFDVYASTKNHHIKAGIKSAGNILNQAILARYLRLSRTGGGGEWPDILESTKKRKGSFFILTDTNTIYHSIVTRESPRVGEILVLVNNDNQHPKSRLSVLELAIIHHRGLGTQPVRPIFPEVRDIPLQTISDMGLAIRNGYRNAIRNAGR